MCTRRLKIRSSLQAINETAQPLVKTANNTVQTVNKKFKRSLFRSKRRVIRYGLVVANIALLFAVAGFVITARSGQGNTATPLASATSMGEEISDPLDTLSSADIAVHIAHLVRLDETVAVVNHADSQDDTLNIVPSDSQIVAKPQIVNTELKSKDDIKIHTVASGETLNDIAQKYGVTSDSIRWSNDLTGASLVAGLELKIPPVDGIVYTVRAGETPDGIATRFRSDAAKIIAFNDAEIAGLTEGEQIVIPDGSVAPPRYSYTSYASAVNFRAVYGAANGYDYGWCTWHAANRRAETGHPLPTNLGNAISWYSRAAGSGMGVGETPQAGAVVWHNNIGGLGHVAYVESVNADGSLTVSDMNYPAWGRVTYRTVTPGEFGSYKFIY